MTRVPLVDLGAQHREVAREVEAGFAAVLAATSFVLGDEVAEFEREFARFCGVARCVGVANGTDALELALRAAALEPPAEVILPANSFVARPRPSCGPAPTRSWLTATHARPD